MNLHDEGGMIVSLLNQVDMISQQFVMHGYQNLVAAYSLTIYALMSLAVIVFGYALLQGWVQLSGEEIIKRGLLWGGILALALNWGIFSNDVYSVFTQAPNEIASHIITAIPGSAFTSLTSGNLALQQAWHDGIGFALAVWNMGSYSSPLVYVWALLLFCIVIVFTGIALFELIVAKFGLAIFLVLAPVVIPTFIFRTTKEAIFDGWFRHLIAFAFIPIFIYCALGLGLALLSSVSGQIQAAIASNNITISVVAPYAIYAFVFVGLLIKSVAMATSMANGFSTSMIHNLAHSTLFAKNSLTSRNSHPSHQGFSSNHSNGNQINHSNPSTTPNNDPKPS